MEFDFASVLRNAVDWLGRFFQDLVSAPRVIWEWAEQSTLYTVIALAAAAAAVAMLIASVVSTIRTLVKKKKLSLFALLFVSLLICIGI